jgi:hypothetical protein
MIKDDVGTKIRNCERENDEKLNCKCYNYVSKNDIIYYFIPFTSNKYSSPSVVNVPLI